MEKGNTWINSEIHKNKQTKKNPVMYIAFDPDVGVVHTRLPL